MTYPMAWNLKNVKLLSLTGSVAIARDVKMISTDNFQFNLKPSTVFGEFGIIGENALKLVELELEIGFVRKKWRKTMEEVVLEIQLRVFPANWKIVVGKFYYDKSNDVLWRKCTLLFLKEL